LARRAAAEAVASGAALEQLRALILYQGGDSRVVDAPELLPVAPVISTVRAEVAGYVSAIDAGLVGSTMIRLGAGRATKADDVDHAVGASFERKVGAAVQPGDVLCTLHLRSPDQIPGATEAILAAYTFSPTPIAAPEIILERIT
ncbi:MAG TPA: pyrimidine-nucleoside phosphorylase, partial [Chloroflexota bacterium]|nr:pyrimidine-nucleoside phosphorylase [Chloroflexota bacterium]